MRAIFFLCNRAARLILKKLEVCIIWRATHCGEMQTDSGWSVCCRLKVAESFGFGIAQMRWVLDTLEFCLARLPYFVQMH
jgi:hypothetical protein